GLEDIANCIDDRQRAAPPKVLFEIAAFEILEDDEGTAVVENPDVDHAYDVLATDPRGRARLAREPLNQLEVMEGFGAKVLDRAPTAELQVGGCGDEPHTADSKDLLDAILARKDRSRLGRLPRAGRGSGQSAREGSARFAIRIIWSGNGVPRVNLRHR